MSLKSSIVIGKDEALRGGGDSDKDVSVSSSTLDKLRAGIKAVEERSKIMSDKWNEKQSGVSKKIICLGKSCGREFKNISGLKAHWRSKAGKECSATGKFEEVPDIALTAADRMMPGDEDKAALLSRGQEAAKRARDEVYGNRNSGMSSPGKVTSETAMKCSPGTMLDRALKQISNVELIKFVNSRFDSVNSSKRVYAMIEMKKRNLSM